MDKEKKSSKGGRPRLRLSEEQLANVEKLIEIGLTIEEIAIVTGVSKTVLYTRFGTSIKNGGVKFRTSLKRAQFKRAQEGSDTMLIWLGKQYLGQKDKREEGVALDAAKIEVMVTELVGKLQGTR